MDFALANSILRYLWWFLIPLVTPPLASQVLLLKIPQTPPLAYNNNVPCWGERSLGRISHWKFWPIFSRTTSSWKQNARFYSMVLDNSQDVWSCWCPLWVWFPLEPYQIDSILSNCKLSWFSPLLQCRKLLNFLHSLGHSFWLKSGILWLHG